MRATEFIKETFDAPYPMTWEHDPGWKTSATAQLPDGSKLYIQFTVESMDIRGYETEQWDLEFWRKGSQEVTGEGDAQRIFATVLEAIKQFIKKEKPPSLKFAAKKPTLPNGKQDTSRANLYTRLVQRYAGQMGYQVSIQDEGDRTGYVLATHEEAEMLNDIYSD